MNRMVNPHPIRRLMGLVVAIALLFSAVGASGHVRAAESASDGPSIPVATEDLVPVLDSPIGHGADLSAGVGVELPVGPDDGAHSALVRLSVFEVETSLVLSVAGAPALTVEVGQSASTTLLVPVSDGTFTVESSATTAARAEVVATFAGAPSVAGSTMALASAINRPGDGVTVSAGPDTPATFGLVGRGGVPAEAVRAVHVSLRVAAEAASVVVVGGNRCLSRRGRPRCRRW